MKDISICYRNKTQCDKVLKIIEKKYQDVRWKEGQHPTKWDPYDHHDSDENEEIQRRGKYLNVQRSKMSTGWEREAQKVDALIFIKKHTKMKKPRTKKVKPKKTKVAFINISNIQDCLR